MDDNSELWLREIYAQARAIRLILMTEFVLFVLVVLLLLFGGL